MCVCVHAREIVRVSVTVLVSTLLAAEEQSSRNAGAIDWKDASPAAAGVGFRV